MTTLATALWREALLGLALLFPLAADSDNLRDVNYVLIEYAQDPERSRLLIFSDALPDSDERLLSELETTDEVATALAMTRHVDPRKRVRALTLLSGVDDTVALDAAVLLLSDASPAVREEAIHFVMDHPDADVDLAAAIGQGDPSARVRQTTMELLDELPGD